MRRDAPLLSAWKHEYERKKKIGQRLPKGTHALWYWYPQGVFIDPLRDDTLYLGIVQGVFNMLQILQEAKSNPHSQWWTPTNHRNVNDVTFGERGSIHAATGRAQQQQQQQHTHLRIENSHDQSCSVAHANVS
jgi:hypothetical protein